MNTSPHTRLTAALSVLTLLAFPTARAEWFVEFGPAYRADMEISVKGGSRAASGDVQAARSGTRGSLPTLGGPALTDDGTSNALRTFDNGYVGPSGWPWAETEGVTQFFGYDTADQYDAGASTLTFLRTGTAASVTQNRTLTRVSDGSVGWSGEKSVDGAGLVATMGYRFLNEDHTPEEAPGHAWSAVMRFLWLEGMDADFRNQPAFGQTIDRRTFAATASRTDTQTYVYDTLGNPFFPAAPYAESDPMAVAPLIADTPQSIATGSSAGGTSDRQVGSSRSVAYSRVDLNVDVQAFALQAGPRLEWNPEGQVSLYVQPALTVTLIDASADRTESFREANGKLVAAWRDQADSQVWRWGAGLRAGVNVDLSVHWYINLSAAYEWVDSTRLNVGPDQVRIDLSGYQGEIALGRSF